MIEFPKIKGIKWLSSDCIDLVVLKIEMVQGRSVDLGLPEEVELLDFTLDISKLVGVKGWWEKDEEEVSTTQCCADFDGVPQMVLRIPKENLIQAWLFYKKWKYDTRNI